jgi:putative MATE family efflux protein
MTASAETSTTLPQLVLPLLINSLLGLVTTLLDTMIISAYSEAAAAAVSLANQILTVAYDLSVLFGVGGTILITHALGRGDRIQGEYIARVAIFANTVFGVILAGMLWQSCDFLVDFINAPHELSTETAGYIRIIALAIPLNAFLMATIACLRGFAKGGTILLLGVIAFPSYLLLDYILVLGLGPIPALGVAGSALATLSVRVGSVLVLLLVMPRVLNGSWVISNGLLPIRALLRRLLALSAPSVLDNVAYGFYQLVLVSFIAGFGVIAVVSRLYTLAVSAFMPILIMAFSQANEVLVGYRHGAERQEELSVIVWRSAILAAGISTFAALAVYSCAAHLIALFTDDAAVHAQASILLYLTIFIQPLSGINTVLFHSLRVSGDVHRPVIFSQILMWGLAVPLGYYFTQVLDFGVAGIWYAMLVEEAGKTWYMVRRWSNRFPLKQGRVRYAGGNTF